MSIWHMTRYGHVIWDVFTKKSQDPPILSAALAKGNKLHSLPLFIENHKSRTWNVKPLLATKITYKGLIRLINKKKLLGNAGYFYLTNKWVSERIKKEETAMRETLLYQITSSGENLLYELYIQGIFLWKEHYWILLSSYMIVWFIFGVRILHF